MNDTTPSHETDSADSDPTPQTTYRRSATLGKLAPALAKAMGEMDAATKDSTNPHFRSRYADLASCHSAAIGPLTRNGFSFPMFPMVEPTANGKAVVTVTALLLHESGEFLEGSITIPCEQANAHGIGSAETYGRRYLYCIVGVVSDDDDGSAATGKQAPPQQEKRREPPAPPPKVEKPAEPPKPAPKPASVPPGPIVEGEPVPDELNASIRAECVRRGYKGVQVNAICVERYKKMPANINRAEGEDLLKFLQDLPAPEVH